MTDELRALLRADLGDELPPPLGDVVGAALRDGRRIRRRRRLATAGTAAAVLVIAAVAAVGTVSAGRTPALPIAAAPAGQFPEARPPGALPPEAQPAEAQPAEAQPAVAVPPGSLPPGSVPSASVPPATAPPARTVTVRAGTLGAEGKQKKATSAAMLHLLTTLLPPGWTSHYGVAADNDLHVQVYYDAGYGPSLLRLEVGRAELPGRRPDRGSIATVTIAHTPDDCVRDTVVSAAWPDGTAVRLDLASCLAYDGIRNPPARPELSEAVATLIVSDARWGVTMDADLVRQGAQEFPDALPVFDS